MRSLLLSCLVSFGSLFLSACEDPCAAGPAPTVQIGKLVGTASFEPLEDGEEVPMGFAPQGGMGVVTTLRTTDLSAHETMVIFPRSVQTHLLVDGVDEGGAAEVLGDFELSRAVYCVDNSFGLVTDVIFGFDPQYNETPGVLDGRTVTLRVEVEDEEGTQASDEVDVVISDPQQ